MWVSHTCAAGDISRTFAPASWSPGASRACAAGDAWRAQRRARKRVFSAVCRSPAVRNSDLQRTALRGSKAASSGGRFLRAPRAGPSLWGRQGRGEKSPWDLLLTSWGVLRRRCARRRWGGVRGRAVAQLRIAAFCDVASLAACEGEEQAVDCVCLLFPSRPERGGPALGRARPGRGGLRRCADGDAAGCFAGTRWCAGPSPLGTARKDLQLRKF